MKYKNIIMVDGKKVDTATLPEEERREFFHKVNSETLKKFGYVLESTQETA